MVLQRRQRVGLDLAREKAHSAEVRGCSCDSELALLKDSSKRSRSLRVAPYKGVVNDAPFYVAGLNLKR